MASMVKAGLTVRRKTSTANKPLVPTRKSDAPLLAAQRQRYVAWMAMTATELEKILAKLDSLVVQCVSGQLTIDQFIKDYGYPIGEYALDGHESDDEEQRVLQEHEKPLELHFAIAEEILHRLCTREQALENVYREAGRIGPDEAFIRLKQVVTKYGVQNAT